MVFGFFRCVGRAIFPDTLCSFKLLLWDDLEFGHQFGAGISAAENAHIGQVADHSSQAARMPALSRAGTVTSIVQIGGDPLCAVTLVYIFVEDQPNDFGFLLVDMQFIEFVLALVDAATFHKVITIRRTAALEVSFFHKLPQAGTGTDGSFFTFSVRLPEADIVQQFVGVVVESLLTLLGTPYPDAVSYKPFYDKWRFICDASDTVEHEHQQNIKFALSGVFLDDLQLVTGFCADFVARHAFFLFFMDDDPALCFGKFVTRLALHGKVCFMVRVEIHLLIGGNTVQAADTVFIFSHRGFLTFAIKARMNDIRLSKNGWSWFMDCSEYHCHPQYSAFFCPRPRCQLVFLV